MLNIDNDFESKILDIRVLKLQRINKTKLKQNWATSLQKYLGLSTYLFQLL